MSRLRAIALGTAVAILAGVAASVAATGAVKSPRQIATALVEQRALAQARPGDPGVWNDLGNLFALAGDLQAAEEAYARALELDPARPATRFNLALLREQRGDLPGAAADYEALLEQEPTHARAQYQLGAIRERTGQRQEALERYAAAFTLDPELLFAENNPHIIENRLVTEALLLAQRGRHSRPATPRAYDDASRIDSLLAPSAAPQGPPASAPGEPVPDPVPGGPEAGATGAAGSAGERELAPPAERELAPPRAELEHRRELAPPAHAGGLDVRSDDANDRSADRVLDASDLRGGVRNQAQGDASALPSAPGTRRRAGATVTAPGGRRPSLHQPPAQDDRAVSFGLRSTGSIEWRLGPASDEPVPAR